MPRNLCHRSVRARGGHERPNDDFGRGVRGQDPRDEGNHLAIFTLTFTSASDPASEDAVRITAVAR